MSTATSNMAVPIGSAGASPSHVPPALELFGPFASVPALEEIERLTAIPDRRIVFRGVDWAFYDQFVDMIPESSGIHVDYDGKDLEVMGRGKKHDRTKKLLGSIVDVVAEEFRIAFAAHGEATWKRPELGRGVEADESYYFDQEKLEAAARASLSESEEAVDFPNPDLAIEVDISRPAIDRPGIYATLRVVEVWRFGGGGKLIIERLTNDGTYIATNASAFLPVTVQDIERWLTDWDTKDRSAWLRKLRTEVRERAAKQS